MLNYRKNLKTVEKFSSLYGDAKVERSKVPNDKLHGKREEGLFISLILFNTEILTLIEKSFKSR